MNKILDPVKAFWVKTAGGFKAMKKPVRIGIIAGASALVLLILGVVLYNVTHPRQYVTLFTELDQEDLATMVTYLESANVKDYKIQNGNTILVPESQEHTIRAGILTSGSYPKSGFGYGTYLNNTGALSSESDRLRLDKYELQDRLGATIEQFTGVSQAVVNISEEEDNRWILNTDNLTKASASVQITMRKGYSMSNELAATIRTLMANAVKGLDIENVSVADQDGKTWSGGTDLSVSDTSALMVALQTQVNESVRNRLIDALVPLFGADNVVIAVNSTVDMSKTYEESITYGFPEESAWNSLGGHGLIGEFVWNNNLLRDSNAVAGGVVGTSTNADLNEYVINEALQDPVNQEIAASGNIIYDNDKTTIQKENSGGVVTDVSVSIGINSRVVEATNIEDMVSFVARAAGIAAELENEKVKIVYRPFYVEPIITVPPTVQAVADWLVYALILGLGLFLLLLIAVLVLRRKAKLHRAELVALMEAQAEEEARRLAQEALIAAGAEAAEGAQIAEIDMEKSLELRQDVRKFAEENPEIAAQMIKSWLRGEDERG